MEQSSSWDTNTSSVSPEIPRILWNQVFHYRIRKSPPRVPILNISSVHVVPNDFFKIRFNIIIINIIRYQSSYT